MKKSIQVLSLVFALQIMLVNACALSLTATHPESTSTSTPTNTTIPKSTLTPSATPTNTPISTSTIPAPDKSLEYLIGIKVVSVDTFDTPLSKVYWHYGGGIQSSNGVVEISGKDWNNLSPTQELNEGEGIIMDFKYSKDSVFETYVSNGFGDTKAYKALGVYIDRNLIQVNVWAGNNSLGGATPLGNFGLQPDTNYSILLAIAPKGDFIVVIWKQSDVSKVIYYHEKIGKNWSSLTWDTGIAVNQGTVLIDNYTKIKFDTIK